MTINEIVENFYTTFKGNKFEASFNRLKEVDGKVAPYFMEDWIRDTTKQIQSDLLKEIHEEIKISLFPLEEVMDKGSEFTTPRDSRKQGFNQALTQARDFIKKLAEEKGITL